MCVNGECVLLRQTAFFSRKKALYLALCLQPAAVPLLSPADLLSDALCHSPQQEKKQGAWSGGWSTNLFKTHFKNVSMFVVSELACLLVTSYVFKTARIAQNLHLAIQKVVL